MKLHTAVVHKEHSMTGSWVRLRVPSEKGKNKGESEREMEMLRASDQGGTLDISHCPR